MSRFPPRFNIFLSFCSRFRRILAREAGFSLDFLVTGVNRSIELASLLEFLRRGMNNVLERVLEIVSARVMRRTLRFLGDLARGLTKRDYER